MSYSLLASIRKFGWLVGVILLPALASPMRATERCFQGESNGKLSCFGKHVLGRRDAKNGGGK